MVTLILHIFGYVLMFYCGLLMWLGEARGGTFWQRLKYFLGNFTWQYWTLLTIAVLCLSIK